MTDWKPRAGRLRRLFKRCEWCGKLHRKSDPVNVSVKNWAAWTPLHRSPFGFGGAMHQDCYVVAHAKRLCLCDNHALSHGDYGQCAFCGGFRRWLPLGSEERPNTRYFRALPDGARPGKSVVL